MRIGRLRRHTGTSAPDRPRDDRAPGRIRPPAILREAGAESRRRSEPPPMPDATGDLLDQRQRAGRSEPVSAANIRAARSTRLSGSAVSDAANGPVTVRSASRTARMLSCPRSRRTRPGCPAGDSRRPACRSHAGTSGLSAGASSARRSTKPGRPPGDPSVAPLWLPGSGADVVPENHVQEMTLGVEIVAGPRDLAPD